MSKHPTMIHDSGFDHYFSWAWTAGGLPAGAAHIGRDRNRYFDPAIIEDGKYVPTKQTDYGPDLYSDWIIRFMEKNKDRPFFAYWPEPLTHEPAGGFQANVEFLDKTVGKVLRYLETSGLAKNTVVFFTGDSGKVRATWKKPACAYRESEKSTSAAN